LVAHVANRGTVKPSAEVSPNPRNPVAPPLPKNLGAERSIIGAILLDASILPAALEIINADDFTLRENKIIFAAAEQLARNNQPVNDVTILGHLERLGQLDPELAAYLSQAADGLPRKTDVTFYARLVKQRAAFRRIIHIASELEQRAFAASELDEPQAVIDQAVASLGAVRTTAPANWREKFHTVNELPDGGTVALIERILPEGVSLIGSLSGVGKTWFALSMARALVTGEKFLGVWAVPQKIPVLYLVPELGGRAFRSRCEKLGIGAGFYCQVMRDGVCDLGDPLLAAAIRELKPAVFLDTAVRFVKSDSENDAAQNAQGLATAIFSLLNFGARAVVGLHHSPKASADKEFMTLESILRGTGDLGAMCDSVWGLTRDRGVHGGQDYLEESELLTRLFVKCVKPRDFEPADAFRIQGRPHIDERGDFVVLLDESENLIENEADAVSEALEADPHLSKQALAKKTGVGRNRVEADAT
jgi:hypothetical protein